MAAHTLAEFAATAPTPPDGNTPYASQYAMQLRQVVIRHAARNPRSLQRHLGPSELGSPCDRQVAGKMAALPSTNHVSDPWPSIMGVAGHKWMEGAFLSDNQLSGYMRWLVENRVTPHPEHPGNSDLYDGFEFAVVDHKFLGVTSMNKLKSRGPSILYEVQIKLYAHGFRQLGLPVNRVVIAAWPRTGSSISGLYVWEQEYDQARDDALIAQALSVTSMRKVFAQGLMDGRIKLMDIPAQPDEDVCIFCPFYRPQSAHVQGVGGCPGHAAKGPH
jgi:hypothetical protein